MENHQLLRIGVATGSAVSIQYVCPGYTSLVEKNAEWLSLSHLAKEILLCVLAYIVYSFFFLSFLSFAHKQGSQSLCPRTTWSLLTCWYTSKILIIQGFSRVWLCRGSMANPGVTLDTWQLSKLRFYRRAFLKRVDSSVLAVAYSFLYCDTPQECVCVLSMYSTYYVAIKEGTEGSSLLQ